MNGAAKKSATFATARPTFRARPAGIAAGAGGTVAMLVVGPLVGLAYILVLPFVGLAALAWMGARALLRLPA